MVLIFLSSIFIVAIILVTDIGKKKKSISATPSVPTVSGPTNGIAGTSYSFSAVSTDRYSIKYTFDWGDGTTSVSSLVASGKKISLSHIWKLGTYKVSVKATDRRGGSSSWSAPITIVLSTPSPPIPSPSGVPMPTGDIPGWKQVFTDDFNGPLDLSKWQTYDGKPSTPGDVGAYFASSHVFTSGGMLIISGYRDAKYSNVFATGGMNTIIGNIYGKYLVRMKMDKGHGIAFCLLLWLQSGNWPHEVDFAEDNGYDRTNVDGSYWNTKGTWSGQEITIDTTQWHTFGVEWTPGKLAYTVDGLCSLSQPSTYQLIQCACVCRHKLGTLAVRVIGNI